MRPLPLLLGGISVGTAVLFGGELIPYHRKATVRCGIPPQYNYVRHDPSNPVTQETFAGVLVAVADEALTVEDLPKAGARPRFWQLRDSELRDAHCAISNVTLWVQPDSGEWRLSLTASQNPFVGPDRQALPAARYLRNRFHVKVRAVAAQPVASDAVSAPLTGPEMFCIEIPGFWIEREQTKHVSFHGQLDALSAARVKYVDRLLVDFQWE